jgi:hypothetical protein
VEEKKKRRRRKEKHIQRKRKRKRKRGVSSDGIIRVAVTVVFGFPLLSLKPAQL